MYIMLMSIGEAFDTSSPPWAKTFARNSYIILPLGTIFEQIYKHRTGDFAFMASSLFQCLFYGIFMGYGWSKRHFREFGLVLLVFHFITVLFAFLSDKLEIFF